MFSPNGPCSALDNLRSLKLRLEDYKLDDYRVWMWQVLKTIYRLTRSDFKTVLFPILTFSTAVVGFRSWSSFLASAFWLTMVLIEFNLSNQSYGSAPLEDAANKPYRPIPSGMMSLRTARVLRCIIPFVNIILSALLGGHRAIACSCALTIIDTVHNDLEVSKYWWGKSLFAAFCYPFGEVGTMVVARGGAPLTVHQMLAVFVSGIVNLLTIHSQDFPDVVGDRANGRKTLPILYPTLARTSIPVVLLISTAIASFISQAHPVFVQLMKFSCFVTCTRYILVRRPEKEMPSFVIYSVWLCALHACLCRLRSDILPSGVTMNTELL
ncbi:hypothetical protein BT69DRAFT_295035 [Atractiella rhizophila]|nr:hypothetical protein BT69DRAFT_295035 [Atractiella rhizophila]